MKFDNDGIAAVDNFNPSLPELFLNSSPWAPCAPLSISCPSTTVLSADNVIVPSFMSMPVSFTLSTISSAVCLINDVELSPSTSHQPSLNSTPAISNLSDVD